MTTEVTAPAKHPVLHHLARFILRPMFRTYFRMRGEGLVNLPRRGPFLLAPNHVSMLDWAFVSYFLPRLIRFVVDHSFYDLPVLGFGLRVNGAIPIRTGRPDARAMRIAHAVLAAGEPLIVFPEGAISRTGRPQRAQPGVISLAAATRAPIVPVAVRGAFEAFPRSRRLPRPGRVSVTFGRPLPPPPVAGDRHERQAQADRLMAHIADLLDRREPVSPW
ncbi:MAG TPA: lysophospholipid acyltransferase family protein [Candidatus Eisenbacteria bacterium]|nr:lysophospholipid acyltransferase family protein [Candidatus Eisenbacteria bacterium]